MLSSFPFHRWGDCPHIGRGYTSAMPWHLLGSAPSSLSPHLTWRTFFHHLLGWVCHAFTQGPKSLSKQIWMDSGFKWIKRPRGTSDPRSTAVHTHTAFSWTSSGANTQIPGPTLELFEETAVILGYRKASFLCPLFRILGFLSVPRAWNPAFHSLQLSLINCTRSPSSWTPERASDQSPN